MIPDMTVCEGVTKWTHTRMFSQMQQTEIAQDPNRTRTAKSNNPTIQKYSEYLEIFRIPGFALILKYWRYSEIFVYEWARNPGMGQP